MLNELIASWGLGMVARVPYRMFRCGSTSTGGKSHGREGLGSLPGKCRGALTTVLSMYFRLKSIATVRRERFAA